MWFRRRCRVRAGAGIDTGAGAKTERKAGTFGAPGPGIEAGMGAENTEYRIRHRCRGSSSGRHIHR